MLWSFNGIRGYRLRATDGDIGEVDDLLFEDTTSTIRYIVVDTGGWLQSRRVLLAPQALRAPDIAARAFPADLTREQVRNSPDVKSDRPVSRQQEDELFTYYGWQPYWPRSGAAMPAGPGGAAAGGGGAGVAYWGRAHGGMLGADEAAEQRRALAEVRRREDDPHLRSAGEVVGYYIGAVDGEIGHVEDLLADNGAWMIRYVVVDTKNWWPGKKVLLAPEWMKQVDWANQRVDVDLTRDLIKSAPEYQGPGTVDRGYEQRLYRHYGQSPYESPAPG